MAMEDTAATKREEGEQLPSDRSRWIASLSYLTFLCFFSLWRSKDDGYIKYHARQGFLLLLAECVSIVAIIILEVTLGRVRFIGFVVVLILQLVTGLGALTLSVVGFVKALFGEYWHLPFLGEYGDKVPGLHHHDS
jgi:fumarate reductase subunit D